MIQLSLIAIRLFALSFGIYHAVLGFLNVGNYENQQFVWVAISLYLLGLAGSIFIVGELRLPNWVAIFNLVSAVTIPLVVNAARTVGEPNPYTTWYVAAIGTLLAITAVRGHPNVAWIGIFFLIAEVLTWNGFAALFNSGLIGALMLVLGAQAASRALAANEVLTSQYRERAVNLEAQTVAKSAVRLERERRIKQTLVGVLPQLEAIAQNEGKLTPKQKKLAVLTEAELRDQIRGRNLSNPELAKQIRLARERGVEVQLLDDGGIEDLPTDKATELMERAAKELERISSGKVVIRSVEGEEWTLTMVAIQKGSEQPDLFLRL